MAEVEYWLRGPVAGIPALLQPVAHALLQAKDEINIALQGFPTELLWNKSAGVASVGFHLQHLRGVTDRLFTYAKAETLSPTQKEFLAGEGSEPFPGCTAQNLIDAFNQQVDDALSFLATVEEKTLNDHRGVGRAMLPSTVQGLLFHAAEHTMRHTGQLLVTARILQSKPAWSARQHPFL